MKSILVVCGILISIAAYVAAWPVVNEDNLVAPTFFDLQTVNDGYMTTLEHAEAPLRQKRATCDLLSGFGVNHGACAAHCILRGNRGGFCNGRAVCVCRN